MKNWQIATIVMITVVLTVVANVAVVLVAFNAPPSTNSTYSYYPNVANQQGATPLTPSQTTPPAVTSTTQISIANAKIMAQNYITRLGNPDLLVTEVAEYAQNFYVVVCEKSTNAGAFTFIIDKSTGVLNPETGPNISWNTKYTSNGYSANQNGYGYGFGPGGEGEMGGAAYGGTSTAPTTLMPITLSQATSNAQQYLNSYYQGSSMGNTKTFYGYYALEATVNGSTYGILSVNGYTGQVWYHTWHGNFIQKTDYS